MIQSRTYLNFLVLCLLHAVLLRALSDISNEIKLLYKILSSKRLTCDGAYRMQASVKKVLSKNSSIPGRNRSGLLRLHLAYNM